MVKGLSSSTSLSPPPSSRHFFKVLMPGRFSTALSIPVAFLEQLKGESNKKDAVLRSCKGSWHVEAGGDTETGMSFKKGWEQFVEEHDLHVGDFLVFEHKGDMAFDVLVFDSSTCEKEFPALAQDSCQETKNDDQVQSLQQANIYNNPSKQPKRTNPMEAAASYTPKNPHFIASMNASRLSRLKPSMNIPNKFAVKNHLTQEHCLTLRDPTRKTWPVKLVSRGLSGGHRRVNMSGGWTAFFTANELKEGDVCLFELKTKSKAKGVVIDVHIFRL